MLLQIYTTDDRKEMEAYVPSAKEICIFYDQAWFPSLNLKEKLEASWSKVFHDHVICRCMHICTKNIHRHTSMHACLHSNTSFFAAFNFVCYSERTKQIYFMDSLMLYC